MWNSNLVSTAKRKSEDVTQEQVRSLENVNRLKAEFLANVSHELRTPVHAIIGYTELLLDTFYGQMTDEHQESVRYIRESAQDLLSLASNLLHPPRTETRRPDLISETVHFT